MELLFKREQTSGGVSRVNFRLWAKLELTNDEQALMNRYQFDASVLAGTDDWELLLKRSALVGAGVFLAVTALLMLTFGLSFKVLLGGAAAGAFATYWYMNEHRETVYVKDLLHGRNFRCESVVGLAKKEAYLEGACGLFRQVMESAKHWDGVERHTIEPLPKELAKEMILKAF